MNRCVACGEVAGLATDSKGRPVCSDCCGHYAGQCINPEPVALACDDAERWRWRVWCPCGAAVLMDRRGLMQVEGGEVEIPKHPPERRGDVFHVGNNGGDAA